MVVLNVTYKCFPSKREEFLAKIKAEGIDASSRSEAGNEKYEYYLSESDSDVLLLIEKWKGMDAIAEHKETSHFARLGELKAEYVEDTVIERFEV